MMNMCMINPLMNCFMPYNFISSMNCFMPFSYMSMTYSNMYRRPSAFANYSIWQNNSRNTTKLEDSLEIKSNKTAQITQTTNTEKTESSILINGIKYNKKNGEALAKRIVEGLPAERKQALCAKYVKEAIRDVGLGDYINGNGEYCKYILRSNSNFKETKVKGEDLSNLPAGCVIVYDAHETCTDKNGKTQKIGKDGHVLITLGDKRGCSDVLEDEILKTDNAYVFIPV